MGSTRRYTTETTPRFVSKAQAAQQHPSNPVGPFPTGESSDFLSELYMKREPQRTRASYLRAAKIAASAIVPELQSLGRDGAYTERGRELLRGVFASLRAAVRIPPGDQRHLRR